MIPHTDLQKTVLLQIMITSEGQREEYSLLVMSFAIKNINRLSKFGYFEMLKLEKELLFQAEDVRQSFEVVISKTGSL